MLWIVTALHIEAEPFIKYFRLKKDLSISLFSVYQNKDTVLCVSGLGPAIAAAAVGFLAGRYFGLSGAEPVWLLHTGFCRSVTNMLPLGTLFYPHTVSDDSTGRVFYMDMLYRHTFQEGVLRSLPGAGRMGDISIAPDIRGNAFSRMETVVDEGAAAFVLQAALKCIPLHRIIIIKTITNSPAGDNGGLSLYKSAEIILPWLEAVCTAEAQRTEGLCIAFTEDEQKLMTEVSERLWLTHAMRQSLHKACMAYKTARGGLSGLLHDYLSVPCDTKREGKVCFARLQQTLME